MPNLLTYGSEKDKLRLVVENGVDASDPRVLTRTNEATQLLLTLRDEQTHEPIIPVGGMMIIETEVVDGYFNLPPEMDSAIHVEVVETDEGLVNGQSDVRQGFYDIVNPFTYVDPSIAHDNPFTDIFLQRSFEDTSKLVRRYFYGGSIAAFTNGTVRVVGPKAYVPITQDSDALLVQNVPALKAMIQSVEYYENNQSDEGKKCEDRARGLIVGEIKRHNMDPRWIMKRRADYETDLTTFFPGTKGWTVARLALEVPGALAVGKLDIGRILDRGQLRMMEAGTFKGCLEQFNARITDGHIYFPSRVESVLGANFEGVPVSIRSMFYKYMESGPGESGCTCDGRLEDEGETYFKTSGTMRRTYRAHVGTEGSELVCVCKLKWEPKKPADLLTIRNLEANRVMLRSILLEQADKWAEAEAAAQSVLGDGRGGRPLGILHKELKEYLRGVQQIANFAPLPGVGDLGGVM